jgi:hydroxymethylpyrimidine/phosphomethylpyrimidine kinase
MDEAGVLLDRPIHTRVDMESGAVELAARYGCAVLLKGGHLEGDSAPDVLVDQSEVTWLEGRRIAGVHTHGTGCTYSAAIATALAQGATLKEAVAKGKTFVTAAISQHFRWGSVDALNHSASQ